MLHLLSCVCENGSAFYAITRHAYFTLLRPAKAHHHWKVECHLLHVSHLHQVTLSFQIVLISSLSKVSPLPWLNSTWQRIVRRGQPNACITPASKHSKLIYPINEEWGLMLMRHDNSTGQLFFIALLLRLWINHKRQSDKYFPDMRFVLRVASPYVLSRSFL